MADDQKTYPRWAHGLLYLTALCFGWRLALNFALDCNFGTLIEHNLPIYLEALLGLLLIGMSIRTSAVNVRRSGPLWKSVACGLATSLGAAILFVYGMMSLTLWQFGTMKW